jgi:hypothetical protein
MFDWQKKFTAIKQECKEPSMFHSFALRRPLLTATAATVLTTMMTLGAAAVSAEPALPDTMTWSSYDVGSAGMPKPPPSPMRLVRNTAPVYAFNHQVLPLVACSH